MRLRVKLLRKSFKKRVNLRYFAKTERFLNKKKTEVVSLGFMEVIYWGTSFDIP